MNFFSSFVLFALAAVALADCGYLKCDRNVRVVSAPEAPVMMMYGGNYGHYPRALPYHIDVPKPACNYCPIRNYGCNVPAVTVCEPKEPLVYKHEFQVQVPQPECHQCKQYCGLVAKPDCVVPAPLECPVALRTCAAPVRPCVAPLRTCAAPVRTCAAPMVEYLPVQEQSCYRDYYRY